VGGKWVAQLVAGLYDMPAALSRLLFQGFYVRGHRTNAQAVAGISMVKTSKRTPQNGKVRFRSVEIAESCN